MFGRLTESRSDNDYGQPDQDAARSSWKWYEVVLLPIYVIATPFLLCLLAIAPALMGGWMLLKLAYAKIKAWSKGGQAPVWLLVWLGITLAMIGGLVLLNRRH